MKNTLVRWNRARMISGRLLLVSVFGMLPTERVRADTAPVLEFSSGLPGKQVRLTWPSASGVRFAVQKSTTLANGGTGGWEQVAMVEATGAEAVWLDPVATTVKAFYRISQSQTEVFSISPPLLATSGGTLVIHGQLIPAGSLLVIQIPGQAPLSVPLTALGNGLWQAIVAGAFDPGAEMTAISIQSGTGSVLLTLNQPLEVTASGLASDSPSSLPPGAPMAAKRLPVRNLGSSGQDGVDVKWRVAGSNLIGHDDYDPYSPLGMAINEKGLPGEKKPKKTSSAKRSAQGVIGYDDVDLAQGVIGYDDVDLDLSSVTSSRKGYQYYKVQSDMSQAAAHHNPYFKNNDLSGEMVQMKRSNKHPDLMRREMGPGGISPASCGLPGEVSFQVCALSLDTPAGPPLSLVHTYRSIGGSGTAMSHWELCYHISVQPMPLAAGSSATRVKISDGMGRADIFHRQADGTYRCDGLFREGHFEGDVFTLTFADKGTWLFNSLSHPTASGKISRIADCNNVALVCDYNPLGKLLSVSSQFGQSLTLTYGPEGSVIRVTDQTGRYVSYAYYKPGVAGGNLGDLKGISCPRTDNSPAVAGPTTFTYTTGNSDPNLNGNLLTLTDGAGRELESFTYANSTSPTALDYDTCASHTRYRTGHVTLNRRDIHPPNSSPASAYTVFEVDEVGRLTETDFDALHREVAVRAYTGFCTPDQPVTASSNRPSGKLHVSDPDFFETTCTYNADSCCTRITRPDGSQELTTYDRDFRKDCRVRERANARVITLRTPGGEIRTVTCDYLPDFGTPESYCPGGPIKGIQVKCGRNPAPDAISASPGGPVRGIQVKCGGNGGTRFSTGGGLFDTDDADPLSILKKEEGGRHTPFHNKYRPQFRSSDVAGITGGVVAGRGDVDDADYSTSSSGIVFFKNVITNNGNANDSYSRPVRIVSAYGQISTCDYDANGNLTSSTSPVPGRGKLYQYNTLGQLTSSTCLNGAVSSFTDTCIYDAGTGFLSSFIRDNSGLHLTTTVERDNLSRVTRMVDPIGNDWLYGYNLLDQCVQVQSPPCPARISTNMTVDTAGRPTRYDIENRGADGSLDSSNPTFTTFYLRDDRANLTSIVTEVRPINDPPLALAPTPAPLSNYDVCDLTLNNAGEVVRVSTPAACRGQASDLVCDFTYNERGLLDRCVEGGVGIPGAVTTECIYDAVGAKLRCSLVGSGVPSCDVICTYDGFHRRSSITDPMGNVVQYAYGNDGSISSSVFGELVDVPGSGANTLLSRSTVRLSYRDSLENPVGSSCLDLPNVTDACYRLTVKNSAFFHVQTEDDSDTFERFTPGSTAPASIEITVTDRSPAGLVQQITRNGDLLETCDYDTAGRLTGRSHAAGHYALTLDGKGCVASSTWTALSTIVGAPPKTFTISRVLDPLSRCIQTTDGVGNIAHFAYDSRSRVVSETQPGGLIVQTAYEGNSPVGPYSSQVSADFDGDGKREVVSSSFTRCGELVSTTDSHGYSTTFSNDSLGRSVRCDRPDGTFETCAFDSLGFKAQGTFSDGSSNSFTHDLNGRTTSSNWSNIPAGVVAVAQKTLQYDGLGNLVSCTQGSSSVTATYDSACDQTSETQNGLTVSRTFNYRGCTGVTYPDGKRVQESRNAFGEIVSVSAINPQGVVLSPPVVSFDFLGHQVCRSIQRNGVTTTFTHRADGEVSPAGGGDFSYGSCVRETITNTTSVVLSDKLVSRDANQRTITCNEGYSVQNQQRSRLTVTPRDVFGNISACVISHRDTATSPPVIESSVSYTYDLDGTRLTELRSSIAGEYVKSAQAPAFDQQMRQYSTWPGGSLTWDPNGNIETFQKGTTQFTFLHDAEGRLVSVSDPTLGTVMTYDYDALSRRTGRNPQSGQAVQRLIYDGPVCIQELGSDNLADMTFVCAGGVRQCISTRNGTIYYPHGGASAEKFKDIQSWVKDCYDKGRLSRVSLITNAAQMPVERFDCDESGKPIFLTGEGTPSSTNSSSIGLRWLSPDCAWEPMLGMYACPRGIYSPDLGSAVSMSVSEAKPQAPSKGGRGFFTLKPH